MIKAARRSAAYECYLREDTMLPMAHIDDCIAAIIQLMEAPRVALSQCIYNIQAMSFDPATLKTEIEHQLGRPLAVSYAPDHRQQIADSWPDRLIDERARSDWKWRPSYDLQRTVTSLLGSSSL